MGLFDVIKGLFASRPPPAPPAPPSAEVQNQARENWKSAAASGDYMQGQSAAYDLADKWLWDEAVAAYQSLIEKHVAERGSIATMIGQALYLGKGGYQVQRTDPEKAEIYFQALDWYVRAAEYGDRGQDLNYVEMCEWLMKHAPSRDRAMPYVTAFERHFPGNEYQPRITAIRPS